MIHILAAIVRGFLSVVVFVGLVLAGAALMAAVITLPGGWSTVAFFSTMFYVAAIIMGPVFFLALFWAPWGIRRG
jgi:hypothetical protein